MTTTLQAVFDALRERMLRARGSMDVATDEPGNLILKTPWLEPGKKEPAWFGAVQLKKNYVSYHLMPIYTAATLAEPIPEALRKRMHGKSCFNFKAIEPELFHALERLTGECAAIYANPATTEKH